MNPLGHSIAYEFVYPPVADRPHNAHVCATARHLNHPPPQNTTKMRLFSLFAPAMCSPLRALRAYARRCRPISPSGLNTGSERPISLALNTGSGRPISLALNTGSGLAMCSFHSAHTPVAAALFRPLGSIRALNALFRWRSIRALDALFRWRSIRALGWLCARFTPRIRPSLPPYFALWAQYGL